MGGNDNETSITAGRAKRQSLQKRGMKNYDLYQEYLQSKAQYTMSFVQWKKKRWKKNSKNRKGV